MKSLFTLARQCVYALSTGGLLLAVAPAAYADLIVPVGGSINLSGGVTDLACTDVIVGGTLDLGGGRLDNVRNLTIQAGGSVSLGSAGSITLAGDWSNAGTLSAGTGTVFFVDAPACAASSTISGNSTFYGLSFISATGKLYRFASGSTQRVLNQLTMNGTAAQPLRIESGTAGAFANIDLAGAQSMANLAVRHMAGVGLLLAPGLTNLAAGGNTVNWFDIPVVPTNSLWSLLGIMLALLLSGILLNKTRRERH
jgi:hypothetical protein